MDDSTISGPAAGRLSALPGGSQPMPNAQLTTDLGLSDGQEEIADAEGENSAEGSSGEASEDEDGDDCCAGEEWDEVDDEVKPERFAKPDVHVGPYGDSCHGRIGDSKVYREGGQNKRQLLEANSNNVKHVGIGGYVRHGQFPFFTLPVGVYSLVEETCPCIESDNPYTPHLVCPHFEDQTNQRADKQWQILDYIVGPFKNSGRLKCEIRCGSPRPSRRTGYELILNPSKKGNVEANGSDSDAKDWLMFDLLRNATSVCTRFRLDINMLLWQNVELYAGTDCLPKAMLDFFTSRPGIWQEIKDIKIVLCDDMSRVFHGGLAFERVCRFASNHLELTTLVVNLEISYAEYKWLEKGSSKLKHLKSLRVTKSCDFQRCIIKCRWKDVDVSNPGPRDLLGLRYKEVLTEKILPSLCPESLVAQAKPMQRYLAGRAKMEGSAQLSVEDESIPKLIDV